MTELDCFAPAASSVSTPVWPVARKQLKAFIEGRTPFEQAYIRSRDFRPEAGRILAVPGETGTIMGHLVGVGAGENENWAGAAAAGLPEGVYHLEDVEPQRLSAIIVAWARGAYQFTAFKKPKRAPAKLALPDGVDVQRAMIAAEANHLVRDLVNTPANELTPAGLEAAARALAGKHSATIKVTEGDALLGEGLRLIHAVGRASWVAPRLIDMSWGDAADFKLTLVGKGVCFDSGGLNIKPGGGMSLMKKDMGGAAHVLGLAHMIMGAKLPVRLRVLIPAVENAIGDSAFRPSDIIKSHKGLTVEIGNTDAEGRLVLADALSVADADEPDLMIDMATLTGAARVALGPDVAPFYTHDDQLAAALSAAGEAENDPVWRMPLWSPYAKWLESNNADISNDAGKPHAGSITAALFLNRFVERAKSWVHFDIFAWSISKNSVQNVGGETQAIRGLFRAIADRVS